MNNMMSGGWTKFKTEIPEKDQMIFERATKGLLGAKYIPFAVASQVVRGTNYKFFCNTEMSIPGSDNYASMIDIYVTPMEKDIHITSIKRLTN